MALPLALTGTTPTTLTAGRLAGVGHHAHAGTHVSTLAVVLAVIGAILVLACLAWALARLFTYEPRWLLSLRHAGAEAGFHVSATWAEFGDWLRLGR